MPLQTHNFSFQWKPNGTPLLDSVDFTLKKGEFSVLSGPNGCGKSTLAKLLCGLIKAPGGTQIETDGLIGYCSQDPNNSIVSTLVEKDVAFGPENLALDSSEIRLRVDQALSAVGLSNYAQADPNSLSLGQKYRLQIAGYLAMEPAYLILDEPTASLDYTNAQSIYKLAKELASQGIGILWITHEFEVLSDVEQILWLEGGKINYQPTPISTASVNTSVIPANAGIHCDEWIASSVTPPRNDISTASSAGAPRNDKISLNCHNISFEYEASSLTNEIRHFNLGTDEQGLSANFQPGTVTALLGSSGSGKSTLLKLLAGVISPKAGQIYTEKIVELGDCSLLWQDPYESFFAETVAQELDYGIKNFNEAMSDEDRKTLAIEHLSAVGLDYEAISEQSPFELSGGQAKLLSIAILFSQQHNIWLLDEPTASLDGPHLQSFLKLIIELKAAGKTMIIVTHHPESILPLAEQVCVIGGNPANLQFQGSPAQFLTDNEVIELSGGLSQRSIKVLKDYFADKPTVCPSAATPPLTSPIPADTIAPPPELLETPARKKSLISRLNNFKFGTYVNTNSVLHRTDARLKLMCMVLWTVLVFMCSGLISLSILSLVVIGLVKLAKLPLKTAFVAVLPILPIVIFTFFASALTLSGDTLHFESVSIQLGMNFAPLVVDLNGGFAFNPVIFGGWGFSTEGIFRGLFYAWRICLFISSAMLLTCTSSVIELSDAVASILQPFKRFKFPAEDVAIMFSLTLRFIPIIMEQTVRVYTAQSLRGAKFTGGKLRERLHAYSALLIPLFIGLFKQADALAIGMESRGYSGNKRTHL